MVAIKGGFAVFVPTMAAAAFAPLELLSQFCNLKEVKTEMMNSIVYKKEEGGSAHVIIALDVSPLSAGQCCHRKPIAYESLSSAHLPRP